MLETRKSTLANYSLPLKAQSQVPKVNCPQRTFFIELFGFVRAFVVARSFFLLLGHKPEITFDFDAT